MLKSVSPGVTCVLPVSAGWPESVFDLQARIVLVSDLAGIPLHRFARYAIDSTSVSSSSAGQDCFHIFVDGSDFGEQSAAWCFVVLSQTEHEFFFHGALWHTVLGAGAVASEIPLNSNSGEAMAMLWAMLWALQHCPGACVNLWSDSQSTVRDVLWESAAPGVLGELLSAVACALRVHSKPSWHYVKAHDGHPWNEMADSLAKWAAKGNLCHLPAPLLPTLQAGSGAAWEWFRVADQRALEAYPRYDGSRLTGTLSVSGAEGIEPPSQMPMRGLRSLSLVSFNVQTLAGKRDPVPMKVDRRDVWRAMVSIFCLSLY